jgi:hypothetical protein
LAIESLGDKPEINASGEVDLNCEFFRIRRTAELIELGMVAVLAVGTVLHWRANRKALKEKSYTTGASKSSLLAIGSLPLGSAPILWLACFIMLDAHYGSASFQRYLDNHKDLYAALFMSVGIAGLTGVGIGIAAIVAIVRSRGRLIGLEMAILGIIVGLLSFFGLTFPWMLDHCSR